MGTEQWRSHGVGLGVTTSDGIQGVRANPILECQDNQRTRSCFFYRHYTFMKKPVVSKYDTKENLFLKF